MLQRRFTESWLRGWLNRMDFQLDVDYRKLRFSNLKSEPYKHLKWLLFWPLFGLGFMFVERFYQVEYYYPMYCPLDDLIPFCEWFFIPYMLWFAYLVFMNLYTLFCDVDTFKRMTKYFALTYGAALLTYFIFPTCQELRPIAFENENFLTNMITGFYNFDTNTNVCPSIHVLGSFAVMEAAVWSKKIELKWIKIAFVALGLIISISTVFMKQHSILDVIAALPLCLFGHLLFFRKSKHSHA